MMSLILTLIVGFIATFIATFYLKGFLEKIGIVGIDVQKKDKPKIATSAGIPVVIGFLSALMFYIFTATFISNASTNITVLFASLTSILIIVVLLLLDDINIHPARKTSKGEVDTRIGLSQWQKVLIGFFASVPLVVLQAGHSTITIPFLGPVNIGLIYPIIIIPLIITFTSNASNMLAGMNGLSTGMGLVLLTSTGLYSLFYGSIEGAIIALSMASCLAAFLWFNSYPASFLPGDTLTYMIGGVFGVSIITGNIEKFALIAYLPWFIEFLLKARKGFKASSLGVLQKDGTLKPKYDRVYSLTQLGMKLVKKEEYITPLFMFAESLLCIIAFIISRVTL